MNDCVRVKHSGGFNTVRSSGRTYKARRTGQPDQLQKEWSFCGMGVSRHTVLRVWKRKREVTCCAAYQCPLCSYE